MGLISNIQDKLSSNKDHNEGAIDNSRAHDATTSGLTGQGSHFQQQTGTTHGTTTTSHNPLSSNPATTHGSSGITAGTHPLVSDNNTTTGTGIGSTTHSTPYSGEGSHLAGATGQHHNAGLTGTQHSGSGLTGASHSGPGLTGSSHTGSGLTGTSHAGTGLTGSSHTGHGIGSNTHESTSTGLGSNTHTTGSGLTGGAHSNTHGTQHGVDFVPASHPNAQNPSAIPTAGGVKVGGVGEGIGHSSNQTGVHETVGDKVKNALPGQHGNAHDAHGNPINSSSTGAHTAHPTGSHATGAHTTGAHTAGGLTGSNHSHSNVGGLSGTSSQHTTHNTQPGSGFSSAAQPLSHDSNFNDRHSGPGVGTGLAAGAVGGAGLASAGHHNSHNQTSSGLTHGSGTTDTHGGVNSSQHYDSNGLTGSNTHNTTTGAGHVGEDHRGIMDKAKDTLSSKRTNQPDDPITGTNYDQKNRDQYTQGSDGTGLTGSSHGNYAEPGIAGITKGVDQTHLGSNTHSGAHSSGLGHSSGVSHAGRCAEWKDGYAAGFREASLSLGSHSSNHTSAHTSATGTHSGNHLASSGAHSSTTAPHSGSHVGTTGIQSSNAGTSYPENTKPSLMDKLNPKKDTDRDGKAGIMD